MGRPKAWLPVAGEPMLTRVVRRVGRAVSPVVVVAAEGQELPELPVEVRVVRDRRPDQGPLEGLLRGFDELLDRPVGERPSAAFVTSCDLPCLAPGLVRRLVERLGPEDEATAAEDGERLHPLVAVYRATVRETAERLLAAGRRRMFDLWESIAGRALTVEEWSDVDPQRLSLLNVNRPEDYERACEAIARGG